MICVCWDQSGIVYYKYLEPSETVNAECYHQQMINLNHVLIKKRPEWAKIHGKVILLHDNAPTSKLVKDTVKLLGWDILPPSLLSSDLAPSITSSHQWDTRLQSKFSNFEEVGKWLNEWLAAKEQFFW